MKKTKAFIKKYWYWLWDILTYNSYRVKWRRDEVRDYDSISVTEILWLLIDSNMEFCKSFYKKELEEACEYWTKSHHAIEQYIKTGKKEHQLVTQYSLAEIQLWLKPLHTEKTYLLNVEGLPPISGTIDLIANKDWQETIIDFKTSRKNRNFKSVKYYIQLWFYSLLSWKEKACLLYLNKKGYSYKELTKEELDYAKDIALELIEYSKELFKKWDVINLYNNN